MDIVDSIALGFIQFFGEVTALSIKEYLLRRPIGLRRCNAAAETNKIINRLLDAGEIENVGESKYDIRRD